MDRWFKEVDPKNWKVAQVFNLGKKNKRWLRPRLFLSPAAGRRLHGEPNRLSSCPDPKKKREKTSGC